MDVKKFLGRVRKDAFILAKLVDRREYLMKSTLPKGLSIQHDLVQVSRDFDHVVDAIAEAADIAEKIDERIARIHRDRDVAKALICRARNEKQRTALWLYYVELRTEGGYPRPLTVDEACGEMGITYNYFKQLRFRGISAIQGTV